jgi:hypothetical protein
LTYSQPHRSPTKQVPADGDEDEAGEAGEVPMKTVDDPVFEAAVRDVMDQVDYERDAERDARREERRSEWSSRWVSSMGDQLGLRDDQRERVLDVIQDHFNALTQLREKSPEERPVLRSEWRAQMNELSGKAEKELFEVLDSSQKQKYEELDDGDKIGGRGSFGRFGGGDGNTNNRRNQNQ